MELRVPYDKSLVSVYNVLSCYLLGEPMYGNFVDHTHPQIEMLVLGIWPEINYIIADMTPAGDNMKTFEIFERQSSGERVTPEILQLVQKALSGKLPT